MKYLTSVIHTSTGTPMRRVAYYRGADKYTVEVDCDGEVKRGQLSDFLRDDLYGCQLGRRRGLAIVPDVKALSIHKHILCVRRVNRSSWKSADAEFVILGNRASVARNNHQLGSAIVLLEQASLEIYGVDGALVSYDCINEEFKQALSLYDALAMLCRFCGVSLMFYDKILVCSRFRRSAYEISFSKTGEARRYFMKMYWDVIK